MNCEKISIMMTDLLAGEISEKNKAVLDSHLASCESCRKEFEELKTAWRLTESALKEDFFDASLESDRHQTIINNSKADIPSTSSKKSTPIKFMWLEIAASIIVCVILAALLLPSLSVSREKARRISNTNELKQIGRGIKMYSKESKGTVREDHISKKSLDKLKPYMVELNDLQRDMPGAPSAPTQQIAPSEKPAAIAGDESRLGRTRGIAKAASKSDLAIGDQLQKERRKETEALEDRAAGKDARYNDSDNDKIAEAPKAKYGNVVFADGHVQGLGGAIGGPSPAVAGEKKNERQIIVESKWEYKPADKNLADDYKYTEVAAAAKPAAPPAPLVTAAPVQVAKPVTPIFARRSLKEEDSKRDAATADYRKSAEVAVPEPVAAPAESAKQLAYDRADNIKAANKELRSNVVIGREEDKKVTLPSKTYSLNLKLWDLTDEKTAREFLKRKGANFAGSVKISISKDSNTITISTTKENLEKADELFSELRKAEDSLKEMKNGIPFIPTKQKPFSTFSIDVDTASYTMARKLLRNGQKPDSFSVRPEEFINYFDYHYRSPSNSTFAVYLESAPSVFRPENYTLRVGVKARELGPDGSRPSVFTILIDASGSMARENRMDLVKKSLPLLLDQMKPDDKVAVFACTHRTINIVNYLPVKDKRTIIKLIEGIMPAGVADIENGLMTAYDSSLKHYVSGAYNRVILLTDGISNIGTHSAEAILAKVSSARNMGITNTVIALGGDGDDKFLETIANKGDGNYVYIENEEGVRELFVNEFAGRFREIARDVKIQVEFNPMIVSQYRQIGYQNRQLSKADFRNDKVDAGEVGAGQSVTALYELKLNKSFPIKNNDTSIDNPINYSICIVRLRYRRADNMDMEEKEFPLAYHELKFNFDKASCGFRLAASVAEFAEFLRYPDVPEIANPGNIMKQIQGVIGEDYKNDGKVSELYSLMRNVK
jgi:Ca-activated chloride channel family protein